MSAISRNPPSQNQLQSSKFQVLFPRISSATYFCQQVQLPTVSADFVTQTTPFVDLPRPSDKLNYGTFSMEFILDEELWGWQIIHDWIRGYTFPCSFEEYKSLNRESIITMKNSSPQYSDGYLEVLSSLNIPKFKVKFVNMFPVSLSGANFNTTLSADQPLIATAQFKYHIFNIERL